MNRGKNSHKTAPRGEETPCPVIGSIRAHGHVAATGRVAK